MHQTTGGLQTRPSGRLEVAARALSTSKAPLSAALMTYVIKACCLPTLPLGIHGAWL